jgi:hypothetical protein
MARDPVSVTMRRRRTHDPIPSQGQWLRQVVTGFLAYHAVPTNLDALAAFRYHLMVLWMRTLTRRCQKDPHGVGPGQSAARAAAFAEGLGERIHGCHSGAAQLMRCSSPSSPREMTDLPAKPRRNR